MENQEYTFPNLSVIEKQLESGEISSILLAASRSLAELKGLGRTLPNEKILLSTLLLQEAMASSEIENIITTQDDIYLGYADKTVHISPAVREVLGYHEAIEKGLSGLDRTSSINLNLIINLAQKVSGIQTGFRKIPGTSLKNQSTGEVIFQPPQHPEMIIALMNKFEKFINPEEHDVLRFDPLVRMALMHHIFESIHPFYDGNGRVGRILNVLYLKQVGLLDYPSLYLSRSIIKSKTKYYDLILETQKTGNWIPWIKYMLECVHDAANSSIDIINSIYKLRKKFQQELICELPRIYSIELLNCLFQNPSITVKTVARELRCNEWVARDKLNELAEKNFVIKNKVGRRNYFVNTRLIRYLLSTH